MSITGGITIASLGLVFVYLIAGIHIVGPSRGLIATLVLATACSPRPLTSEVLLSATVSSSAAGGGTTGTTDRAVTITPAYGTLLVACASLSGNTQAAPSMTDNQGGTYALAGRAAWGGNTNTLLCYVRESLVTNATATTLTLDTDVNTAGEFVVVAYAGMERTGAVAIKQVAYVDNQAASTAPSATFAASATTTNATMIAVASGDTTTSPPTGWTERRDASQATPTTALEVATRNSGFTGTTITSAATQSSEYAAMTLEIDADPLPVEPPPDTGPDAAPLGGAHGIVAQLYGSGHNPAQVTLDTTASGSTFIVAMGGKTSDIDNGPTDNKGNTYSLIGSVQDYADWPGYGTSVWVATNATGGPGHVWSQYVTDFEEVTVFVVEIPNAGANPTIASAFSQRPNSGATSTQTSSSVTTTGPSRELAFWFGAGPPNNGNHVATPNNGFTNIEGYGYDDPNGYVQGWMAYKVVPTAGTYDVTWTQSPIQGAQLRLVAVQP